MILLSFICLIIVGFVFKKLWLGTLAAVIFYSIFAITKNSSFDSIIVPMSSGFLISLELFILLFGAYLFLSLLLSSNHFIDFAKVSTTFSSKLSIVIILCLFFGSFIEGIAGFGIPAILLAPLMLVVGFRPLTSLVLPLAANTIAVTFGALGTPFKIGLGIHSSDTTVSFMLLLNTLPAMTLPFIMAFLYGKTEQVRIEWVKEWKLLLGAGFCFLFPYLITGYFSIELPSVVAGVLGLLFYVIFFIPQKEKPTLLFWWRLFYPYILFLFLLVIAKYYLIDYVWKANETLKPISFYQPGIVFVFTGFLYLLLIKEKKIVLTLFNQSRFTFLKISRSLLTIFLLVSFAQLIQQDITGIAHLYYSDLSETAQVLITPSMGVMGSFITGSATMSNLLWVNGVKTSTTSVPLLLALLATGSAMGNAISLQNIIMAKSAINSDVSVANVLHCTVYAVSIYLLIVLLSVLPLVWKH